MLKTRDCSDLTFEDTVPSKLNSLFSLKTNSGSVECRVVAISPNGSYCISSGMNLSKLTFDSYAISYNGKIVAYKPLPKNCQLEDATIANNGAYCFTAERFDEKASHIVNTFMLFDQNGVKKAEYKFDYVSNSLILSDSGELAVIFACQNIKIYSVLTGSIVSDFNILNGRASSLEIDEAEQCVRLRYIDQAGKPVIRYTFSGVCLDKDLYSSSNLDGFAFYASILGKIDNESTPLDPAKALAYAIDIDKCFKLKFYGYQVARAYRLQGELYLQANDKRSALISFEKALEEDPKIGVKKKVTQLKNELKE